jgi:hypothetical protein
VELGVVAPPQLAPAELEAKRRRRRQLQLRRPSLLGRGRAAAREAQRAVRRPLPTLPTRCCGLSQRAVGRVREPRARRRRPGGGGGGGQRRCARRRWWRGGGGGHRRRRQPRGRRQTRPRRASDKGKRIERSGRLFCWHSRRRLRRYYSSRKSARSRSRTREQRARSWCRLTVAPKGREPVSRCRARLTLRSPPTRTRRALFGRQPWRGNLTCKPFARARAVGWARRFERRRRRA